MSEQADALNRLMRERGIIHDDPDAPLPFVALPTGGVQILEFARNVGSIIGKNGVFRREQRL